MKDDDTTTTQRRRLRSHFGFSKMPFCKAMWAAHMFDSSAQRELLSSLGMWIEVKGIALVSGPSGVGKSITLRRFAQQLDEARYRVIDFAYVPCTITGFLRSLNRKLGLPMRLHTVDLFDAAQSHLATFEQEHGPHPVVVLDDAEGLRVEAVDTIRRLTSYDLDAEDRFSVLISGTDEVLELLRHPDLAPLRTRVSYAQNLKPFGLEDTTNYVRFHLARADVDPKLFTDAAVKRLFQASQGRPRGINQLAVQALIQAAVLGRDSVDGNQMASLIAAHPFYQGYGADR
jgi:type II secretory pathway predicted ATPase ExeA